jgi:ribose transport system permease protein
MSVYTETMTEGRHGFLKIVKQEWRLCLTIVLFMASFASFLLIHPRGLSVVSITPWANQVVPLAFAAVAQFFAVVTGGLDLSVGAIITLSNAAGSYLLDGTPLQMAFGVLAILAMGTFCGLVNGIVITAGRIEPIVATLATGAIYSGIALFLRPSPGGTVNETLGDLFTYQTFGVIPTSLILLAVSVCVVWLPLSRSLLGRSLYAVGSNITGVYMSGLNPARSKVFAYALSGFFASCAGLFLSVQTLSGDASIGIPYTLNSIAAVVLGGASLAGGIGTIWGAILGSAILRTVGAIVIFTSLPSLAQPLFEGGVLLLAVAVGAIEFLKSPSKMEGMR